MYKVQDLKEGKIIEFKDNKENLIAEIKKVSVKENTILLMDYTIGKNITLNIEELLMYMNNSDVKMHSIDSISKPN